jgi:putative NADH-flavin reductase
VIAASRGRTMASIPTIAIFGASSGTGLTLVAKVAAWGWPMRVLVRREGVPFILSRRLEVHVGDLLSPEDVAPIVKGCDVVCCLFGPRRDAPEVFCAEATRNVVQVMKAQRVRRLICVTGALIGDYPGNRTAPFRWVADRFARRLPALAVDRAEQERIVRESGLEWTLVKPPRLTDGPRTGSAHGSPLQRVGLLSKISRKDLAEFILDEIGRPGFIGRTVFIAG